MMKSILAAAAVFAISLGASTASAATYLVQFDDIPGALTGIAYRDGVLLQSYNAGAGGYDSYLGVASGALLVSDIDIKINLFEPGGLVPSDTWRLFGLAGNPVLELAIYTDTNGVVPKPLAGAVTLLETGDWQTLAAFATDNGDEYTVQFRSDPGSAVPEPTSWALMILGFGGLGIALRSQRLRLQPA